MCIFFLFVKTDNQRAFRDNEPFTTIFSPSVCTNSFVKFFYDYEKKSVVIFNG